MRLLFPGDVFETEDSWMLRLLQVCATMSGLLGIRDRTRGFMHSVQSTLPTEHLQYLKKNTFIYWLCVYVCADVCETEREKKRERENHGTHVEIRRQFVSNFWLEIMIFFTPVLPQSRGFYVPLNMIVLKKKINTALISTILSSFSQTQRPEMSFD